MTKNVPSHSITRYEPEISQKSRFNPDSIRNGSILMRTVFLTLGMICAAGMAWKKRRDRIRCHTRYNVMTLNETVLLVILIQLDHYLHHALRGVLGTRSFVFTMEMLRNILIENIFFKFVIPVYLIVHSRTHLPALWVDSEQKYLIFSMTKPSFIPRPVVSKYQTHDQSLNVQSNYDQNPTVLKSAEAQRISNNIRHYKNNDVTVTIHQPEHENILPAVVD